MNPDPNSIPVPDSVRKEFPELVELILASPSMNQAERTYWVQTLPTLKENQISELRQILVDEKNAMEEIDAKHAENLQELSNSQAKMKKQSMRSQKIKEIQTAEAEFEEAESNLEDQILNELNEQ